MLGKRGAKIENRNRRPRANHASSGFPLVHATGTPFYHEKPALLALTCVLWSGVEAISYHIDGVIVLKGGTAGAVGICFWLNRIFVVAGGLSWDAIVSFVRGFVGVVCVFGLF